MEFNDWLKNYTNLFVAVNFPEKWIGQRVTGNWSGNEVGGNIYIYIYIYMFVCVCVCVDYMSRLSKFM